MFFNILDRGKEIKAMTTFCHSNQHQNKYVELASIFHPSKLHRAKYIKTASKFFSSKLRRKNYVETKSISLTEITSKKYVKTTWKFVEILFLTYRRNIDIKSTLIQHVVSDGCSKTNFISNIERV